jgi:hypothetical protein
VCCVFRPYLYLSGTCNRHHIVPHSLSPGPFSEKTQKYGATFSQSS